MENIVLSNKKKSDFLLKETKTVLASGQQNENFWSNQIC